jgi:hypothetical protein
MKQHNIILILLFAFMSIVGHPLCGQNIPFKKVKELKPGVIDKISVDRLGNFFLVFYNGTIRKYDAQGKVMASLLHHKKVPALLEPWYHPSIFVYNREKQQCLFYDRNFENVREYALDPAFAIEPTLVCPSNDNKLWIFDHADFSLKKVNYLTSEVITEFSLDSTQFKKPQFTYLREYQNMIFLQDKNSGIVIINNIGKQIRYIKDAGIRNFNFFGEELYYLSGNTIRFFDLYSEDVREVKVEGENKYALVTDERIILVSKLNKVILLEYHPLQ